MNPWKITWWDGCNLRETVIPPCDPYNVTSYASGQGVQAHAIIKMERIAT